MASKRPNYEKMENLEAISACCFLPISLPTTKQTNTKPAGCLEMSLHISTLQEQMVCGNLETLVLPVKKLNFTDTDVDSMLKCLDIPEIGRILCIQHPFCRSLLCKLDFFGVQHFLQMMCFADVTEVKHCQYSNSHWGFHPEKKKRPNL